MLVGGDHMQMTAIRALWAASLGFLLSFSFPAAAQVIGTQTVLVENRTNQTVKICLWHEFSRPCATVRPGNDAKLPYEIWKHTKRYTISVWKPALLDKRLCGTTHDKAHTRLILRDVNTCTEVPKARPTPINTLPGNRLQVGAPVFAEWSDGKWYPGYLEGQSGNRYTVKFWDGDRATVTRDKLRRDTIQRGDNLFIRKHDGNKLATLTERHGFALIVTYPDGSKEAVPMTSVMVKDLAERLEAPASMYKPAVLANICNNTSQTVYVAMAVGTNNGGAPGHASSGWRTLAAGECDIRNITQFWRSETRNSVETRSNAPTYIYGQTKDAFQNRIAGGAITIDRGLKWGGEDGENEFCIKDRPTISFRHVVDRSVGLFPQDYCKDSNSFKVSFNKLKIPPALRIDERTATEVGGVVNWTFGE